MMCSYCTQPASDVLIDPGTGTITGVCSRHTDGESPETIFLQSSHRVTADAPVLDAAPSGIYWRDILHRAGLALIALAALALCLGLFAWMLSTFSLPLMHSLSSVMSLTMLWSFGIGMSSLVASLFAPR